MKVSLADLPLEVREAFQSSAAQPYEIKNLEKLGAFAEIEAVATVDNPNGVFYITRDGGQSFEVNQIVETVHLRGGNQTRNEGIVVRRVHRISETGKAG